MNLVDTQTGEIQATTQDMALVTDHFHFTPTGLEIIGHPTFEQCEETAYSISFFGKMAPIWLADLLNYMENVHGEKYAQVLDATGYAYQTIANAKSVMGRVAPEVRQDGLTLTHYGEVASLPPPQQERLLRQAKEEELNTSEFKRIVRREKREARLGDLPQTVKMEVSAVFDVPVDLKDKLRFGLEGLRNRLEEWDIECDYLDISEIGQ